MATWPGNCTTIDFSCPTLDLEVFLLIWSLGEWPAVVWRVGGPWCPATSITAITDPIAAVSSSSSTMYFAAKSTLIIAVMS